MDAIRFLIADDHPVFREGLARMLEDEGGFECVGKAEDGKEAIKLAKKLNPDIVLIDVSMPNLGGTQAAKEISKGCPDIAVIMISAFNYESYILSSLKAGAKGYISKTTPLDKLISAIRLVHSGEGVLDLKATDKLVHFLNLKTYNSGSDGKNFELLYPRELEVLELAAEGMSNKQIAAALVISERTVQTHLVNIFRKLGANSRTQAVLHALREGWIVLEDSCHSRR